MKDRQDRIQDPTDAPRHFLRRGHVRHCFGHTYPAGCRTRTHVLYGVVYRQEFGRCASHEDLRTYDLASRSEKMAVFESVQQLSQSGWRSLPSTIYCGRKK